MLNRVHRTTWPPGFYPISYILIFLFFTVHISVRSNLALIPFGSSSPHHTASSSTCMIPHHCYYFIPLGLTLMALSHSYYTSRVSLHIWNLLPMYDHCIVDSLSEHSVSSLLLNFIGAPFISICNCSCAKLTPIFYNIYFELCIEKRLVPVIHLRSRTARIRHSRRFRTCICSLALHRLTVLSLNTCKHVPSSYARRRTRKMINAKT